MSENRAFLGVKKHNSIRFFLFFACIYCESRCSNFGRVIFLFVAWVSGVCVFVNHCESREIIQHVFCTSGYSHFLTNFL